MRLLWITPGFAADEEDLVCIPPLQLLAGHLLSAGVDLHIIPLEYPFAGTPYTWKPEGADRAAHIYPCDGRNRRWVRWRTFSRAVRIAQEVISDQPLTCIHSFWLGPAWQLGKKLARRYDLPHRTTLMGQDVLPGNRYLKYLKLTDTPNLIALSDFHNTVLKETTGYIARQVIPWGIPTTEVPVTVPERRPIDVLGVGSLVPVKNWGRWLRIVREAANQVPDLQAVLIGNGPEENRLKEQAHALGLEPYLRFAGKLDRPDVLAHMAQSKVLLHTARFESFGYVFVEAAAQGCRIVSTPVGCAPAHWACSPNDDRLAALLAKAIQAPLPNQPDVPYSMEQTTQAYLELYGNVKKV